MVIDSTGQKSNGNFWVKFTRENDDFVEKAYIEVKTPKVAGATIAVPKNIVKGLQWS